SDPRSPSYGRHRTFQEIADRIAPRAEHVDAVLAELRRIGQTTYTTRWAQFARRAPLRAPCSPGQPRSEASLARDWIIIPDMTVRAARALLPESDLRRWYNPLT